MVIVVCCHCLLFVCLFVSCYFVAFRRCIILLLYFVTCCYFLRYAAYVVVSLFIVGCPNVSYLMVFVCNCHGN